MVFETIQLPCQLESSHLILKEILEIQRQGILVRKMDCAPVKFQISEHEPIQQIHVRRIGWLFDKSNSILLTEGLRHDSRMWTGIIVHEVQTSCSNGILDRLQEFHIAFSVNGLISLENLEPEITTKITGHNYVELLV